MAKLEILRYPDPRLRTRAQALTEVTDATRRLVGDMLETMYEAPGIGLAATQVDVHQRVIVMDVSEHRNEPRAFINPRLVAAEGEQETTEGCLSIPEYVDTVRRAERVSVDALDRWGEPFALEADGLLAVCLQHEIDHLNGKLFIDYLSALKRNRLRRRFDKQARQSSTDGFSTEQVL